MVGRGVVPDVHRNVNVFPQSTCLQQFLIHVIRAQLGNLVTDSGSFGAFHSEGGDKSRAASRNHSFLNPMDEEETAAFKSMF